MYAFARKQARTTRNAIHKLTTEALASELWTPNELADGADRNLYTALTQDEGK
jgi:hypothetical protein